MSDSPLPEPERVRAVMREADDLDLSDGAYWALVHDRLGLKYGAVFDYIAADPDFFGYKRKDPEG